MRRKALVDWLAYFLVRCFVCLIQTLRLETCEKISRALAFVACDLVRLRGKVVEQNLRQVFPSQTDAERRRTTRCMWEHLFLMICEIAHAPRKIHRTNWRDYLHIPDHQGFLRRMLDPRARVLVSGHFGNFEVAGFATGRLGFPTHAVARTLDNPYLDRYVNRFRQAGNQFIIPKDGSAAQIQEVLQSGGTLSLLGDQHAGAKGCWIDFFGRPASCHKAIALFSLTAGAPLLVAYAKRTERPLHYEAGIAAVADPAELPEEMAQVVPLTQWYNRTLEQLILSAPDQYWWLHRRWKEPPPGRRRRRTPNREAA